MFDRLLSSGIPITFTTVGIAYFHRFTAPWNASTLIITEQVLAFALDQIGYVLPELEDLTAELAFAHPTDTWTINRCLERLMSDAPEDMQYALWVWRWALLNDIITRFEAWDLNYLPETDSEYGAWSDDIVGSIYYNLNNFWECFEYPSEGIAVIEGCQYKDGLINIPGTIRLFETYRRWLDYELALLRSHSSNSEI